MRYYYKHPSGRDHVIDFPSFWDKHKIQDWFQVNEPEVIEPEEVEETFTPHPTVGEKAPEIIEDDAMAGPSTSTSMGTPGHTIYAAGNDKTSWDKAVTPAALQSALGSLSDGGAMKHGGIITVTASGSVNVPRAGVYLVAIVGGGGGGHSRDNSGNGWGGTPGTFAMGVYYLAAGAHACTVGAGGKVTPSINSNYYGGNTTFEVCAPAYAPSHTLTSAPFNQIYLTAAGGRGGYNSAATTNSRKSYQSQFARMFGGSNGNGGAGGTASVAAQAGGKGAIKLIPIAVA